MKKKRVTDYLTRVRWTKLLRVMKLTAFLIFVFVVDVSASLYSQNSKVTVKIENGTLSEIFERIERQSEFRFFYQDEQIQNIQRKSIDVFNQKIDVILSELLNNTGLDFKIMDRHIILFSKTGEIFKTPDVIQQQKNLSGKVTDSSGTPLPGVTVVVKGTTTGIITDANGNYSLSNIPENATLQFSFVGMKSQEIVVRGKSTIDVVLTEETIGIEEVVAIGYGTMKKSDLTGSVVRANSESIKERPNVSVFQSLQGVIPGLNVGPVNQAGGEPGLSIRGRTSISGESAPLIVVDNVIFRGNLIDLNPSDIASVDILKDASSAAIYGSQASNGVILITTARGDGKEDKPVINFSATHSFQEPAKELGVESPEEFIQRMCDADLFASRTEESGYLEPNPDYDPTTNFRTNEQINAYRNGNITNWHDLLTNDNMYTRNYNLSLANRTKNSGYHISIGYTDVLGYMVNEDYNRWNARINIDNSVTDWLDVGIQSFMTISDYSGANIDASEIYYPWYAPAYKEDGSYVENPKGLGGISPLFVIDSDDYAKRLNIFGNIYANINIPFIKGLSFKTNYTTNYKTNSNYYFQSYANSFQGTGGKREEIGVDWSNDNILSYKNTFNEKHAVDLTLVYGMEKRKANATLATATSFINDELGYNNLQAGVSELQSASSGAWEEASLYNMGRVFYGYNHKYLFTGTIRRDGFSGFSEENKFGLFPSASVAWVVSEESFLKGKHDWLDLLKVRLSYGSNGNRTIGRYQTLATVAGGYNYINGSKSSIYSQSINRLASPNLKWETTTGINIGFDFALLNQRVIGAIEYYNNNTKDLLYNVDIPGISRYNKFPDNLGKIHNNGLELSLSTINIKNKDIEWTSSFAFSRNRNELKELLGFDLDGDGKEDDLISEGLFIGKSLSSIYTYKTNGNLWQLGEDIPATATLGSYKIEDLNDDGEITPKDDRTIIGYRDPSFRFSIDNKFKYKNWMLSFFINSIQGNKKYYLGADDMTSFNVINSLVLYTYTFPSGLDYWLPENPDARYQRLAINVPSGVQAQHYISRSFVRLQDITLSYNFKSRLLNKVNIQNLRLYFNGKNLFTWTKWPGWDPETGESITRSGRPVVKNYTFGIEVKL